MPAPIVHLPDVPIPGVRLHFLCGLRAILRFISASCGFVSVTAEIALWIRAHHFLHWRARGRLGCADTIRKQLVHPAMHVVIECSVYPRPAALTFNLFGVRRCVGLPTIARLAFEPPAIGFVRLCPKGANRSTIIVHRFPPSLGLALAVKLEDFIDGPSCDRLPISVAEQHIFEFAHRQRDLIWFHDCDPPCATMISRHA